MKIKFSKKHIKEFKKMGIQTIYLFGSRAGGRVTPLSDFDFAVLVKDTKRKKDFFKLKLNLISDLESLTGRDRADVVVLNDKNVPLSLKYRVIKNGKLVYEKDELARSRFEYEVMREYLDRKYYFDRHVQMSLEAFAAAGLK